MNKKKLVMSALLVFTLTISMFSSVTVHATDQNVEWRTIDIIAPDSATKTESDAWKKTVDMFIQYMRSVNWNTENSEGGVISRHFFKETPHVNDVVFVTYYNENYHDTYYDTDKKETRIPYDVLIKDANKYYKQIPDLKTMNTSEDTLHYDSTTNEFVWLEGGGVGSEPLVTEIVKVDDLENRMNAIRFKVSEEYDITQNPDMNNPENYIECTLVVEDNGSGQWRYVSFLEGYPEQPVYLPTLSLASSTWTGEKDIILTTETKGGQTKLAEMYLYVDDSSIGGIRVTPDMKLDSNGKGTITFHSNDLKKATMFGPNGEEKVDWTKISQIEISFSYELNDTYKMKRVYVPVVFKTSNPSDTTTTIKNDSGVTMILPENAPDNLELKVTTNTTKVEKSAIEKVVKIDDDKIKTFDLSLLLNGKTYVYDGQFTSTVSLPIPDGWDMNKLALYYFNEDTKEVKPVTFNVDKVNGNVVFSTNHFSKYILIQKDTTKEENKKTTNPPKTDDKTNITLLTTMLTISALGIVGLEVSKKKRTHR